jgi:hypothetical protein
LSKFILQVADEAKYMKILKADRSKQLHELRARMDETFSAESINKKAFEDETKSSLTSVLASDDSRRAAFQLTHEEQKQNVTVCVQFPVLLKILNNVLYFFPPPFLVFVCLLPPFPFGNYVDCVISMCINNKCCFDRKSGYTCFAP